MTSEIELGPRALVIADLHLDVADPERVEPFARWLDQLGDVTRLVILGDLFDVWVGPAQAREKGAPRVLAALAACTQRGIGIELVPGNRDFLLDRSFAERTGARLHADGFVALCDGRRLLFIHGDTLCTKDVGYVRLRRVLRSRPILWLAPRVPLALGSRVARRLRRESVRALAAKLPDEKSIQRSAVVTAARAARCDTLVCGHAHEFRDERLEGGIRFVVVDAFGGARDAVKVDAKGELTVGESGIGTQSERAQVLLPSAASGPLRLIAIDGPAAAGKSTVARLVAQALGLTFLDTGAMYRAVTWMALERGVDPHDADGCARIARAIKLTFDSTGAIRVDGRPGEPAIRSQAVTDAVSPVSAHPGVRAAIVPLQRIEAEKRGGIVAEGRDIGSVVFPGAGFKFYLDASSAERARRRVNELDQPELYAETLQKIQRRDHDDSTRKDSPLKIADGAIVIQTDGMDARAVAEIMLTRIRSAATAS
ncbi:MAG: (d)CMP kinase [Planctomycetes bacterium]|nr:(d)CMP kinase [Planctomycetota bacterium]